MLRDHPPFEPFSTSTESSAAPPAGFSLLDELTGLAVSGRDVPGAVQAILSRLASAVGADAVQLLIEGLPGDRGRFVAGGQPALLDSGTRALARLVREGRHPLLIADLSTDARVPEAAVQDLIAGGSRTYLCQPLLAGGSLLGTLHLAAGQPERFAAGTVEQAGMAARVLALLVQAHRSRLEMEERAESRAREVALLLEVSRSLGDTTGGEDLSPLVLEALPRLSDLDLGLLLLAEGADAEVSVKELVPVPASLRTAARQAAMSAFLDAGGLEPPSVRSRESRAGSGVLEGGVSPAWRSVLHRPLHRRGEVAGMVSIFAVRDGAFGEAEERLLTTLAGQVSLTVERLVRVREDERSRVEFLVDAMGEGLLWIDASGRLQMTNPAGRRSLLDLTGEPHPTELPQLGDVKLTELLKEFAGGRRTRHQAEVGSGAAGRRYTLTAAAVEGRGGGCDGMVIVLSDITEQAQLREQLMQTDKLSALGEMISGVAHELNNPLAAVMGFAQLLETTPQLDENVRRKVKGINEEAQRCGRIVRSLLSFARHHNPRREPVDLNGVVRSVMQLMEYPLRSEGVKVTLDLSPELPAVRGDPHILQQVLLNLVTNANHAMRESGRPGHLQIVSRPDGDRVKLLVEDNGVGITAENLRRVFDPFFTTKKFGQGTGLGLSLAYGCIQEHDGTILADSRHGEWTRFHIELPVSGAAAPRPRAAAMPASEVRKARPGRDILVVDDEPKITEFIAEALGADGHRVDVVHDGMEARRRLQDRHYDLIITDLKMPRMNGRELYEDLLRRSPEMASRVIFSTGDTVSRDTAEFLQGLGDRYLAKPFRLAELQAMVDRVLGP